MLSRDFEPGGPVKYNLKDIATIRHLAASNALILPMFTAAARQIEALVDGWGWRRRQLGGNPCRRA